MPNTSVTTYALPSEINGGSVSDSSAKARRVQQQIQMRLAEKSTLPRQNGSTSHYAMSDYGGSSSVKYNTYQPSFSSKSSFMYTGSRTLGPQASQRGFSTRSAAPDLADFQRMSIRSGGAGHGVGGGGGFYQEEIRMGGYQGSIRQPRVDPGIISSHSIPVQMKPWNIDSSDAGSLVSERDATFGHQYAQSAVNGYTSQVRQGGGNSAFQSTMRRSLSGTLSRGGGMSGGVTEIVQQPSFKGPAHRTISRITNRNRMSMGSVSGTMQPVSSGGSFYGGGGDVVDQGFMVSTLSGSQGNLMQRQGTMSRAMSVKSMHSVGRGMDIYEGQMDLGASMGNLSGITMLDMRAAVQNLRESEPDLQVLGAAYIQHQCYNDKESKDEVRNLKGIVELVKLFKSKNPEVRRYATGAARNIIYENMENKMSLIEQGGIENLVDALKEPDDELRKNITGILWNLSSKESLKEKLAKQTLSELSDKVLTPLSASVVEKALDVDSESDNVHESPSETEIFCNTTGCLRNLSSASEKTRSMMRDTRGLVESLVNYIKASLKKNRANEKGVENSMCVLRNLSYQLYSELPPSILQRLAGPTRDQDKGAGDFTGCFTPQSRKTKNKKNLLPTVSEVARTPKEKEWLWHPDILKVYHELFQKAEINRTTREAAAGALQNITAGEHRWASVMSCMALEKEQILPTIIDNLRTENDLELRSLTGFLRNLSRHTDKKDHMASKVVSPLVEKLPEAENQKLPSSDVMVNICGVLNNLVTNSINTARDITTFGGLQKLMNIRDSHDHSPEKLKASKAAATVITNMYNYKKLQRLYQSNGYSKQQFIDNTF
ncbi:plakophilin-3a isoform X2 [Archocentrus centrarchus]|uniref:plakophilin-3a isoform X2 n=1 Tax=Archocentrus centrarchus TaxID=63155 RepID=UPI0011EA2B4A|nr:plakophilin-3 isoform X2 [Archocentrus centrarchus]